MVVDERVPGEARRRDRDRGVPGEAHDGERDNARPGQPGGERPCGAREGERQPDGERGEQRAERILGERGQAEHAEPEDGEAAAIGDDRCEKEREATAERGQEDRFRTHIAPIGEEAARGEQRDAGQHPP